VDTLPPEKLLRLDAEEPDFDAEQYVANVAGEILARAGA
jgi:hypothetical protein